MSSQSEVSRLSIELVQGVTHLARSLVAAARNWTLYPPEHPATKASFDRLSHAIQQATNDAQKRLVEAEAEPGAILADRAELGMEADDVLLTDAGAGGVVQVLAHPLLHLLALDEA